MKNTIYVIGPKSVFDEEFALYEMGEGWYFQQEFDNWGAIRYSLDNQWVLLEEIESKFHPDHLAREDVQIFTEAEIKQYLIDHKEEWEVEDYLV